MPGLGWRNYILTPAQDHLPVSDITLLLRMKRFLNGPPQGYSHIPAPSLGRDAAPHGLRLVTADCRVPIQMLMLLDRERA